MTKGSMDHRTRITKLMIRQAFTGLLSRKPIQRITIKEICESADINRGTFYSHYTDIYGLLDEIENEMMADFEKSLEPLLTAKDREINPVEISTEIFQCLKDNADICTVTLGDYGDKEFAYKLINLGRERCLDSYSQYYKTALPKQIEYFYAFVSAGCIGLLRKWLKEGMESPASEIAKMAERIMLCGIGFLEN